MKVDLSFEEVAVLVHLVEERTLHPLADIEPPDEASRRARAALKSAGKKLSDVLLDPSNIARDVRRSKDG